MQMLVGVCLQKCYSEVPSRESDIRDRVGQGRPWTELPWKKVKAAAKRTPDADAAQEDLGWVWLPPLEMQPQEDPAVSECPQETGH